MEFKDLFMLELDASSGGRHFMGMMPQSRKSLQERHVIVCQNGAAAAVADLKREIGKQSPMIRRKITRRFQSRYML